MEPLCENIFSLPVIYGAYVVYARRKISPFMQTGGLWQLSFNEWYIDDIYKKYIVKPVIILGSSTFWFDRRAIDGFIHTLGKRAVGASKIAAWADRWIIDGFLHVITDAVHAIGNFARRSQGGKVQYYLYSMLAVILM